MKGNATTLKIYISPLQIFSNTSRRYILTKILLAMKALNPMSKKRFLKNPKYFILRNASSTRETCALIYF